MASHQPRRPDLGLIPLEEALLLDGVRTRSLYAEHVNPGLGRIYDALGLARLEPVRAEGAWIELRDGRRLLDFSTAFGVVALGHNHPRILRAERRCHDARLPDAMKLAPLGVQAALAHNLAALLPEPLSRVFLAVSGAEAVEAAIKLCRAAQAGTRDLVVVTEGAFHGKTLSTLAFTRAGRAAPCAGLGLEAARVRTVPFGDADALRTLLSKEGDRVAAMLVEPILGESIEVPPAGHLAALGEICRAHGVLVVADEVKTGLGRTGALLASAAEGLVPDVVVLSKALGGGRRALAATVTSPEVFDRAYGRLGDANAHSTTFGGLPESCAVGIEMLQTLVDDDLVARAGERGKRLERGLAAIAAARPDRVLEARGRGLLAGLRLSTRWSGLEHRALMPALVRALAEEHGLLVHFCESAPDVLHLMPPLVTSEAEIDHALGALRDVLEPGRVRSLVAFAAANLRDRLDDLRGAHSRRGSYQ